MNTNNQIAAKIYQEIDEYRKSQEYEDNQERQARARAIWMKHKEERKRKGDE